MAAGADGNLDELREVVLASAVARCARRRGGIRFSTQRRLFSNGKHGSQWIPSGSHFHLSARGGFCRDSRKDGHPQMSRPVRDKSEEFGFGGRRIYCVFGKRRREFVIWILR